MLTFIVNPAAGSGHALKIEEQIRKAGYRLAALFNEIFK